MVKRALRCLSPSADESRPATFWCESQRPGVSPALAAQPEILKRAYAQIAPVHPGRSPFTVAVSAQGHTPLLTIWHLSPPPAAQRFNCPGLWRSTGGSQTACARSWSLTQQNGLYVKDSPVVASIAVRSAPCGQEVRVARQRALTSFTHGFPTCPHRARDQAPYAQPSHRAGFHQSHRGQPASVQLCPPFVGKVIAPSFGWVLFRLLRTCAHAGARTTCQPACPT